NCLANRSLYCSANRRNSLSNGVSGNSATARAALIAWFVFSGGLYFRAFGKSITETASSYLLKPSANSLANCLANRSIDQPKSAAMYGFGRRNKPSVVRCGHVSKYSARRRVSSSQRIVFSSVQKRLETRWYLKSDKARQPPTTLPIRREPRHLP